MKTMTTDSALPPESPVRRFFSGAGFPASLLTGAIVYEVFLLAVVFAPPGWGLWSRFSQDFKVWCFRYDARTGGMSWAAVWVMLVEPLFLAAVAVFLWRRNLRELLTLRGVAAHWRAIAGGGMFALAAMTALFFYGGRDIADTEALPFPGERIRTQIEPPGFQLTDQRGEPVSLEDLKGNVVLITGVYAMCSTACPEILREVKNLIESLPPEKRGRFSVIALSLNPEYDTSQVMNAVAGAYGFAWPQFRYANGDPQFMRDLLTRFQFSPVRNESTGVIEHANLFILLDARGVIAYRFNLNQRHLPWLRQATLDLLNEAAAPALADARGP
jgi:protein SCO1/2